MTYDWFSFIGLYSTSFHSQYHPYHPQGAVVIAAVTERRYGKRRGCVFGRSCVRVWTGGLVSMETRVNSSGKCGLMRCWCAATLLGV